jgi:Jacalin-like lectin domain/Phosphatidylinositol-specific phospholipase C, X domain
MNNANWMQSINETIAELTLRDLILPGTHDSGTYDINMLSGLSPDVSPWANLMYLSPVIGPAVYSGWAKAQGQNIAGQLASGIRYLDLRVASDNGKLRICHGMYSDYLDNIIAAVGDFSAAHDQEIIVLHFQHFYDMDDALHGKLIALMRSKFGSALISRHHGVKTKLKDLAQAKQRIAVIYCNDKIKDAQVYPDFWTGDMIDSPWGNKDDLADLKDYLNGVVAAPAEDKLFVLQGVLTPNATLITKGLAPFTSGSLSALASRVSPQVLNWVQNDWRDKRLNILMIDWAEYVPMVEVAKNILVTRALKISNQKSDAHGGGGGSEFTDTPPQGSRLSRIVLRSGSVIDALQLEWTRADGRVVHGIKHGGEGGSEHVITLAANEKVTRIDGRSGAMVDSLTFHTNTGKTYGPFGGNGGGSFSEAMPNGFTCCYGRSGSRIDAIGFFGQK